MVIAEQRKLSAERAKMQREMMAAQGQPAPNPPGSGSNEPDGDEKPVYGEKRRSTPASPEMGEQEWVPPEVRPAVAALVKDADELFRSAVVDAAAVQLRNLNVGTPA